jgi:hypothetical protein
MVNFSDGKGGCVALAIPRKMELSELPIIKTTSTGQKIRFSKQQKEYSDAMVDYFKKYGDHETELMFLCMFVFFVFLLLSILSVFVLFHKCFCTCIFVMALVQLSPWRGVFLHYEHYVPLKEVSDEQFMSLLHDYDSLGEFIEPGHEDAMHYWAQYIYEE